MKLPFPGQTFCIDTSALIDLAHNYPKDVFAPLWAKMEQAVREGRLLAPHEVLEEIKAYKGKQEEPRGWARAQAGMFVQLTDEQLSVVGAILATHRELVDHDKTIPDADPFVIALAKAEGGTVVTSERPARLGQRPKIPDVCAAYGVPCLDLVEFFRAMGWAL
ncbi:MAG: DUF4411 family protein [Deltaproteobacteria bacterium]|nr:DUF4411 family protein [Deltaproteobacteria bacterium]